MTRVNNKALDFDRYKEKWGLTDYRFRIAYKDEVDVVPKNFHTTSVNNELRTVHNLMKRRNNRFRLIENLGGERMDFDGLNELLEYMLVKKIAL